MSYVTNQHSCSSAESSTSHPVHYHNLLNLYYTRIIHKDNSGNTIIFGC